LRKIWLVPPESVQNGFDRSNDEDGFASMPMNQKQLRANMYASGPDLRQGVRVVARYNDRIVLFTVPPDIFNAATDENDVTELGGGGANKMGKNPRDRPSQGMNRIVTVAGCYVDTLEGLIDLAVDSGVAMTVYAFSSNGIIRTYQLAGNALSRDSSVIRKIFGENGGLSEQKVEDHRGGGVDGTTVHYYDDEFAWYEKGLPWDGTTSEVEEDRFAWETIVSEGVLEWEFV
jgi:hypothetical protein